MQIKPLNDWAVVIPSEAEERTAGGLYIPDSAKEKPAEGTVETIGPGALEEESWKDKKEKGKKKERKFIPTTVKPGERILYERFAGTNISIGGIDRVLVRERSILGIFTGAAGTKDPKTFLLPSRTSSGETSLAKAAMTAITANAPAQPVAVKGGRKSAAVPAGKKAAARKPAKKKAAKTVAKKTVKKKLAKKTEKRSGAKKAAKKAKKKR
jgi:chaperonin GroES